MSLLTIDRAGIAISALCIIHCLLLPLAASVLPIIGLLAENENIHKALVLLAIVPAAMAFSSFIGSRMAMIICGLGVFGILTLIAGAFVESFHDFETIMTVIGAFSLASAHILRLFAIKSHHHKN